MERAEFIKELLLAIYYFFVVGVFIIFCYHLVTPIKLHFFDIDKIGYMVLYIMVFDIFVMRILLKIWKR